MKPYPEKYDNLLKEEEEILWHKKATPLLSEGLFAILSIAFGTFAVFLMILAIYLQSLGLGMSAVFLSFLFVAIHYQYNVLGNAHFLITNQRIIRDTKPRSKFQIYQTRYKEIHEINIDNPFGKNTISYYLMPRTITHQNTVRAVLSLPEMENEKEVLHLLQETWMPQSPYQIFVDKFQDVAQKYNLEFEGFHPHGASKITLKGEIDGMPFLLSLSELYDVKKLSITITCPNAERNFLAIIREKSIHSISKLMGTQDLKTNNKRFDDKFILQSDNQHFFEKILDTETQDTVLVAARLLDWKISFGTKPYEEKNRTQKKGDEDILDAHLTIENPKITERNESDTSPLIYECDNLVKHSSSLKAVAENCISNMEMMIELAKRIKAYNR